MNEGVGYRTKAKIIEALEKNDPDESKALARVLRKQWNVGGIIDVSE